MQIQILGSGTAFNTDGRGFQAVLVRPETGAPFFVDVGPTVTAVASRLGIDFSGVDHVFVTHLHGDHVAGWPFVVLHMVFLQRRTRTLHVHGPIGTRDCLEGLERLCYADALPQRRFDVVYHELPVAEARDLGGDHGAPRFDVWPMRHHATSLAYRFQLGERGVGVTGDTGWCDNLERLALECDLLLLECTSVEEPVWAHVSLREVRERRERLGCGEVLLVHLPDEVAASLARDPLPRVLAAYDGLALER